MEFYAVELSIKAKRDLKKVPKYIINKLIGWTQHITEFGLSETKKIPGYHDEPLKGRRKNQRSIRLSKAYRAIYEIDKSETIHFIEIIEVNKHEY